MFSQSREFSVSLPVTITQRNGSCVASISADDLSFVDNGNALPIMRLTSAKQAPVRYVVLIDTSGSMRLNEKMLSSTLAMIADFIVSDLRPDKDQAAVITFGEDPALLQPFTSDPTLLRKALTSVHTFRGGTALYETVVNAARYAAGENKRGDPFRLIEILISDGSDNASRYSRDVGTAMAAWHGATVYGIRLSTSEPGYKEARTMGEIAEATGGEFFRIASGKDLARALDTIRQARDCSFLVEYSPPKLEAAKTYKVRIEASAHPEWKIVAPREYLVPKIERFKQKK